MTEPHALPLLERDVDADPLRQFAAWFEAARAAGLRAPEATALATATPDGTPSVRMVLLKGFDEDGFVFYTGYGSRKALELEANPRAALLLHWDALGRQVRIEGGVTRASREESEAYFRTRPRGRRIGAWASRQSEPIAGRDELERRRDEVERRHADEEVPVPPAWGGYRLAAGRYEFWQHREDRLHDRLAYTRSEDGWSMVRLSP